MARRSRNAVLNLLSWLSIYGSGFDGHSTFGALYMEDTYEIENHLYLPFQRTLHRWAEL